MQLSSSVWKRTASAYSAHTLSKNAYMAAFTAFIFAGILVTLVTSRLSAGLHPHWYYFVGVLAAGITGVLLAMNSKRAGISLLGYALVAGPYGLILGPVMAEYDQVSIARVLVISLVLVAVMGLIGTVIPESLHSWGPYLFCGLIVLLAGLFFAPFGAMLGIHLGGGLKLIDWAVVAFFSAYVMYDFNRAARLERTLDNAVDSALAVYLDWLNLVVWLLEAMGNNTSASSSRS